LHPYEEVHRSNVAAILAASAKRVTPEAYPTLGNNPSETANFSRRVARLASTTLANTTAAADRRQVVRQKII